MQKATGGFAGTSKGDRASFCEALEIHFAEVARLAERRASAADPRRLG